MPPLRFRLHFVSLSIQPFLPAIAPLWCIYPKNSMAQRQNRTSDVPDISQQDILEQCGDLVRVGQGLTSPLVTFPPFLSCDPVQ